MVTSLNQSLDKEIKETSTKIKKILMEFLPLKTPKNLYEASTYLIKAGGKMLRPYLVVKSCEAVGGEGEKALPAAAAIEMLHTFTLIHDDIMDEDTLRRGVPSVHVQWGLPMAIVTGDLLFSKVFEAVAKGLQKRKISPEKIVKVINIISQATITICEGQVLDLSFSNVETISEKEYFGMIKKKTSCLFKTSAIVGALIGGGLDWQIKKLGNYGDFSGIAFQIVDDVLGLKADEKILGKPVGSDLRERKKTLPIIYALKNADKNQKKIILASMRKNSTQTEILEAIKVIEKLGSIEYSIRKAEKYVEKALKQLEKLPKTNAKTSLESLARFIVKRKF